jgi:hypothetical protein
MTQTVKLNARLNGKHCEILIPGDTIVNEGGHDQSFGIIIGYDDDGDPIVRTFAAYYKEDKSDVDYTRSLLKAAKTSVSGALIGGTMGAAVRKGSRSMLTHLKLGGVAGVFISVAWDLGKHFYDNHPDYKQPVGYTSEEGDIIDQLWQ